MKTSLIKYFVLTGFAVVFCWRWALAANPEPATQPAAHSKEVVTRWYDLTDLLYVPKNHPLDGDVVPPTQVHEPTANVQSPSPFPANPQADGQERANRLEGIKKLIIDTVDTSTWKDNGGDVGSISSSPLRAELIITTTAETQTAISGVLDELRKRKPGPFHIRADWALLEPGQLGKLLKNGNGDPSANPEINSDMLQALPQGTAHLTAQFSCVNEQTVHLASGRARNIVTNVMPVVAPGTAAMDPTMTYMHYGVSLEVTINATDNAATLDLSSVVSEAGKPTAVPSTQPGMDSPDRLNNIVQTLNAPRRCR